MTETVLTTQLDPRIEAAAKAIHDVERQDGEVEWDDEYPATRDTYAKLAKAAADALGVAL